MIGANQDIAISILLDDITYMLYDLERGEFISNDCTIDIGGEFTVAYRRELVSETITDDFKTIVSNFFISATKNKTEIVNFVTNGVERKFTLFSIEGFVCGMFLDELDKFRRMKFQVCEFKLDK